jgi:O-antigen polysaccharide polymerase Wzy-like protein
VASTVGRVTVGRVRWAAGALLCGVLAWPGIAGEPGDLMRQAALFLIAWSISQWLLYFDSPYRALDVGVLYLLVFGLFHGGLLVVAMFRQPGELPGWLTGWHTPSAVRLVIIAMLTFAIVFGLFSRRREAGPANLQAHPDPAPQPYVGRVGVLVLLAGLVLFAISILAAGFNVLQQGYGEFVSEYGGNAALSYALLFVSVGAALAVAGGGTPRRAGWLGFLAFAAVAFPLGTRGAVLFPLVALVALEARRGMRIKVPLGVALILALFSVISLVRSTRAMGARGLLTGAGSFSPLDAVAEMGHSLLPTIVVLDWHSNGEPFRAGITFVAVPVRLIERLTGWHGGPPVVDDRLFNQEIMLRVGAIGGSPVAEGYHNLGTAGVIIVMSIIALVLGLLARRASGPFADSVLAVTMIPLVTGIRNSTAPTLTQVFIGLVFVGVSWILWRLRSQRAVGRSTTTGGVLA